MTRFGRSCEGAVARAAAPAPAPAVASTALAAVLSVALTGVLYAAPALALSPDKNEKAHLKACERRLCSIIVGRKPKGPDLRCKLSKTWSKSALKKGGKKSRVSWLFGDARCQADIALGRAMIINALSGGKIKIKMPLHVVNCQVERSNKLRPVKILIAPKIQFKHGRAKKIWLNVKKVHGPGDVKGLIWTVAKLEDSIGIFHRPMVRQVNKFIHAKCTKVMNGTDKK